MENGIVGGFDALDSCRSVNMCDSGQHLFPLFTDVRNTTHERSHMLDAAIGKKEPLLHIFGKTCRCKRSKFFAELDFPIQAISHIRLSRVGNDGSGAEGSGAVFKTALYPAPYLTIHQTFHNSAAHIRRIVELFEWNAAVGKETHYIRFVYRRAEECVIECRTPRKSTDDMCHIQRCAQRSSHSSGRGLNVNRFEWPFAQKFQIGDTVQRNAARQGEILFARNLLCMLYKLQHVRFCKLLKRCCNVAEPAIVVGYSWERQL